MTKEPQIKSGNMLEYRPQLDGTRFFAVLVVMFYHELGFMHFKSSFDIHHFICFFFVLSGYLITKILISAKQRGVERGQKKVHIALAFLARRTLRIFPAYYFYLLLIMMMPIAGHYARSHAASFFFYFCNHQIYVDQVMETFATPHLWTLAVEEQFYLVWPWLVLFIPNRHLPKLFILFIIAGVLFRFGFYYFNPPPANEVVTLTVLTPANLDAFGFGALLAYQHLFVKKSNPLIGKICLILLPFWIVLNFSGSVFLVTIFSRVFIGILSMCIVEQANLGTDNLFGKFFGNKVVVYLGKISYGMYLYHLLAPVLFWKLLSWVSKGAATFGVDLTPLSNFLAIPWINVIHFILSTIVLAMLSWYLIEKPINSLKRFVRYNKKNREPAG